LADPNNLLVIMSLKALNQNITALQTEILEYVGVHPFSSAYQMYKRKALTSTDYRFIRKNIDDLVQKGFIKRCEAEFSRKAKLWRLTTAGIAYLILKRRLLIYNLIIHLFENYGDDMLFKIFLYPYVEYKTIRQLSTFNSLSPISQFLYDICGQLKDSLELIQTSNTGYVMEAVVWQSLLSNNRIVQTFRNFLKNKFNVEWADHANFKFMNNYNTLKIQYKSNSVLVVLNDEKKYAILKVNGRVVQRFTVYHGHGGLFHVNMPSIPIEEQAVTNLKLSMQKNVNSFIVNMLSWAVDGSDDLIALRQDKRFNRLLIAARNEITNQFSKFIAY
jgi:DNA-binding MarR family transcriptional regulator